MAKLTIDEMQEIAKSKGGKCLSTEYVNSRTKLEWECAEEHIWFATPGNVKNRNSWCAECVGLKTLTIEEMQEIAKSKGGKCLSTKYVNKETNLEWECTEGHAWFARPGSVKNGGHWCLICAGSKKLTIEEMQKIAEERGGKCLSTEYVNSQIKLKWECAEGHTWFANAIYVKNLGGWCLECSGKKPLTIEEMHQISKSRGGKCLSTKYVNKETKLEWECAEGHTWFATPGSIKNAKSWCPTCNFFYSEEICRTTFEQLFDADFIKYRPDWLINSNGNRMELDGYCGSYNIAFEYNGRQHYQYVECFNKNSNLETRKLDDELKVQLCKTNNIFLFVITYEDNLLNLPKLIKKKSYEMSLNVGNIDFDKAINLNKVYQHKTYMDEMQEIAKSKGGKCLSTKYVENKIKLEWECAEGHTWFAAPKQVKYSNSWCPTCAYKYPLKIQDAHQVAKIKNGKCLSTEYLNSHTKLEWECAVGHTWFATLASVKNEGTWCLKCSIKFASESKKLTIEEMQKIAKDRGGKCLSTEYVNSHTKLEWECAEEHIWFATPSSIKNRGSWCEICSNKFASESKKLTIEEMQKIAEERGGKCLSTEYVNSHTKLEWECAEEHTWFAKPCSIKNSHRWCPHCAKTKKLTIEKMQKIAVERGGKCLSTKYLNQRTKLEFECAEGHTWFAKSGNIKNSKSWCPDCATNKHLTIEEIQKIAEERGGKCLSAEYVNSQTNLKWECAEGHTWFAKPGDIKNGGTWCPHCYKESRKIK
jgi:hypothetical protein